MKAKEKYFTKDYGNGIVIWYSLSAYKQMQKAIKNARIAAAKKMMNKKNNE